MKRRITTLILCLAVAFTMAAPTFAVQAPVLDNSDVQTVSYFALGDSIGAGCKNIDFLFGGESSDQDFLDFNVLVDGQKNVNPYAVPFSFINRIARTINADRDTSVNGAYIGFRAKDICNLLDIKPYKAGDYEYTYNPATGELEGDMFSAMMEWVTNSINPDTPDAWNKMLHSTESIRTFKDGIENADVITVELGQNDLTAALVNNYDAIVDIFARAGGNTALAVADAQSFMNGYIKFVKATIDPCKDNRDEALSEIFAALGSFARDGGNLAKVTKDLLALLDKMHKENNYYNDQLINYINKHKQDDAILVVGTLLNPFADMDAQSLAADMDMELAQAEPILKILKTVMGSFVDKTNKRIKDNAVETSYKLGHLLPTVTRNYYVADFSDVSLNPEPDRVQGQDVKYVLHPNDEGQQEIADAYIKAINKALKAQGKKPIVTDTRTYSVALNVSNGGSASVEKAAVTMFDDVNVTITPDNGYLLKQVLVNGQDLTPYVDENGVLKLENVKSNLNVQVKFKAKDEDVLKALKQATLKTKAQSTSDGVQASAKVGNVDLDAIKDAGYKVEYKWYRAVKGGKYQYRTTTKKFGVYSNTAGKKGKTYYYKYRLVVTNPDGKVIYTSPLSSYAKAVFKKSGKK